MDYVRDPYTIKARPFRDNPTEVDMVWRPASPDAECFPEPHKFGSLFSGYFNWADGDHVGEVFKPSAYHGGIRAVNRWFNNKTALGYDVGLSPCEPLADFATGETFDPTRPPVRYNADGFPRCCLDRSVSRLGIEWGLRAVTTVAVPAAPGGSCETATQIVLGVTYTGQLDTSNLALQHYWRYDPTGEEVLRITYGFPALEAFAVRGFVGHGQCFFRPTLATIFQGSSGTFDFTIFGPSEAFIMQVNSFNTFPTDVYRFKVERIG